MLFRPDKSLYQKGFYIQLKNAEVTLELISIDQISSKRYVIIIICVCV